MCADLDDTGEIYRQIVEGSDDLFFLLDREFKIYYSNEKALKSSLGYSMEDIHELSIADLIHVEEYQVAAGQFEDLFENPSDTRQMDIRLRNADGNYVWFDARGSVFEKPGEGPLVLIILRNISVQKSALESLEGEIKHMRDLNEMQKGLVDAASHELKTPLANIEGAARFLDEGLNSLDPVIVEDLVKLIRRGTTRLRELVEELLDYARLESGRMVMECREVDLVPIIIDSVKVNSYVADKRHHTISVQVPESLNAVADPTRIEQVLTNLLANAIKNTPPGGIIQVTASKVSDYAYINVTDNGIGLTPQELQKLFTVGKFDRSDSDADIEIIGSGLGLWIAKQIVERHEGQIWAESEGRGTGSKFTFTIPLVHPW
jgi:PAS domain S-box-containing protein